MALRIFNSINKYQIFIIKHLVVVGGGGVMVVIEEVPDTQ